MSQVIDKQIVEELLTLGQDGDSSLLLDLIRSFREQGPDQVEKVLKGLETQDLSLVEQGALSLRSMAGNLGAFELLGTCARLLAVSRRHEWDEVRELGLLLRERFVCAFEALEKLLERYG
jgi:HPt (histidine-containing phosphotransfer) domain-containing protein